MRPSRLRLLVVLLGLLLPCARAADVPPAAAAIRAEATRPNHGPEGRPLPLASHWCTGSNRQSEGWRGHWQMELIAKGHHLLPWFQHPRWDGKLEGESLERFRDYYEQPIKQAAAWKLPLCFRGSQWEHILSRKPFVDLPPEQNPNVLSPDGKILKMVSPFGPVEPWRQAGRRWTDNPQLKLLQEWYPDPPLVIFLSNNEHRKLRWHQMRDSKRYQDRYGKGREQDFKRKVVADGWIERYRALQAGLRDGLASPGWRKNAMFVGYGAFGPAHMGRWGGWPLYSLHSKGRISPAPLMWDGGSPSYYTHDWNPSTDHTVWSPQVQFMNLVFMKAEALKLNPRFWFEFSVWDGYSGPPKPGKKRNPAPREIYRMKGQTYNPARYGGFVQFGMWLTRPRAVREFRNSTFPRQDGEDYFLAIVAAVDRVHRSPTLRTWWRKGRLVPNRAKKHVYQANIPPEYQDVDRWFLLDASANPQMYPWELFWNIPVFSLALVQGTAPERQWLVYAHSPLKDRTGVKLTIPDYREVAVDVAVGGSFHVLDEKTGGVKRVE